jgi:hypothetical protein
VDESSLVKLIANAVAKASGSLTANVGTTTAGVAPNGSRGSWDR